MSPRLAHITRPLIGWPGAAAIIAAALLSGCSALLDPDEGAAGGGGAVIGGAGGVGGDGGGAGGAGGDGGALGGAGGAQPSSGDLRVAITTPRVGGAVSDGALIVQGSWRGPESLRSVTVTVLGEPGGADAALDAATQRWSAEITLPGAGVYTLQAKAEGPEGEVHTARREVIFDQQPPQITITAPTAADCLGGAEVEICALVTDDHQIASVRFDGRPGARAGGEIYCATLPTADGISRIPVVALDGAGLQAEAEALFTVDLNPPTLTFDDLYAGQVIATGAPLLTVAGQAQDAGCGVLGGALTLDGEPLSYDSEGRFSTTLAVAEGERSISWQLTDTAGNTAEGELPLIFDATAPAIALAEEPPALTASLAYTLTGVITEAGAGLTSLTLNGLALPLTEESPGLWRLNRALTLRAGRNDFTLRAADAGGLVATRDLTLVADPTPPNLTIESVNVVGLDAPYIIASGTADDGPEGAGVASVTVNGVAADLEDGGRWAITHLPIPEGPLEVEVVATDALGNASAPRRLGLIQDETPPTITPVDPPTLSGCLRAPAVDLCAHLADREAPLAGATLAGVAMTDQGDGLHCATVDLAPGLNDLPLVATNALGLSATVTYSLTRDEVAPTVRFDQVDDLWVAGAESPALTGVVEDEGCGVIAITLGDPGVQWPLDAQGRFSAPLELLDQPLTVPWVAEDAVGNRAEGQITAQVDAAPPSVTLLAPATARSLLLDTDQAELMLTVDELGAGLASVTLDGEALPFTVDAATPTQATVEAVVDLVEGENDFTVVATDALGQSQRLDLEIFMLRAPAPPALTLLSPDPSVCAADEVVEICGEVVAGPFPVAGLEIEGLTFGPEIFEPDLSFCVGAPLDEGSQQISVVAVDELGQRGAFLTTVNVDRTPPTLTSVIPSPERPVAGDPQVGVPVRLVAEDEGCGGRLISAVVNGAVVFPDPLGDLNTTLQPLSEGPFEVSYTLFDDAGNTAEGAFTYEVDLQAPAVTLLSPEQLTVDTESPTLLVSFQAEDTFSPIAEIRLDGEPVPFTALEDPRQAELADTYALPPGGRTFAFEIEDAAGQIATLAITATRPLDQDEDGALETVDCDDLNPDVRPGAPEILRNGVDDDCDAATLDAPLPGVISVIPSQDTTLQRDQAQNLGRLPRLYAERAEGEATFRPLTQFEIPALTPGMRYSAAAVELVLSSASSDAARTICAHRVLSAWVEGEALGFEDAEAALSGATWQRRTPAEPWGLPGGDFDPVALDCQVVPRAAGSVIRFDVSDRVIEGAVEAPAGFIFIASEGEGRQDTFHARESEVVEARPRLQLTTAFDPTYPYADLDGDGFLNIDDCDDGDFAVNPGAVELLYDQLDNDCDPSTADFIDADGDGFNSDVDCNDDNRLINPDALEILNDGVNNDCDPATPDRPNADLDGDGFIGAAECNDEDPTINPDADEILGDGIDNDCDPNTPDTVDADGDGFDSTVDCDDDDANVSPGAEEITCNGVDDDCSPATSDLIAGDLLLNGALAPRLKLDEPLVIGEEVPLSFAARALVEDPDGAPPPLYLLDLPPGARWDAVAERLEWTPDFTQGGATYPVRFLSEEGGCRVEGTLDVQVTDDIQPPAPVVIAEEDLGDFTRLRVQQMTDAWLDSPLHAGQTFEAVIMVPAAAGPLPVKVLLHDAGGAPSEVGDPHAIQIAPHDPDDTAWWGYSATQADLGGHPGDAGDDVAPYTARRVLHLLDWALTEIPEADGARIYVTGQGVGGTGAALIAGAFPRHFAVVEADRPHPLPLSWPAARQVALAPKWGLPAERAVWSALDLTRRFVDAGSPLFWMLHHGKDDPEVRFSVVAGASPATGASLLDALQGSLTGHLAVWDEGGAVGSPDPVLGEGWWSDGWHPIFDEAASIRLDQAWPAFTDSAADEDPGEGDGAPGDPAVAGDTGFDGDLAGARGRALRWDAAALVDEADRFELPLYVADGGAAPPAQGYPPLGDRLSTVPTTATVTVRNIQRFFFGADDDVRWIFGEASGVVRGADGLITLPGLTLTSDPQTLILERLPR